MAYSLGDRFPAPPKYYRILDPGAYQNNGKGNVKENKAPFLSNTVRKTQPGNKIWTNTIYYAKLPPKIPNCTSLQSKLPRFAYEAMRKEYLNQILCRCGIPNQCECPAEDDGEKEEIVCQGKIPKYLFIGHPPRSFLGDIGLSSPSKRDRGFEISANGHQKRVKDMVYDSPQFYDARVIESTAFYHGCKWSRWTSKRSTETFENRPGPADYTLERQPTEDEICAERVRHYKRKTSKQLRFIEIVQQRNISEGRPGPSTYSPKLPKYECTEFYGPKADRFATSKYIEHPGPADYSVKRDFELPEPPKTPCHTKLPEPPFFGVKAVRFKPHLEEGPSPANYTITCNQCHFMRCSSAPFNSSSVRFKDEVITENADEEIIAEDEPKIQEKKYMEPCPTPTWEFKSKTVRMKPLVKKPREPSPADLPQPRIKITRLPELQYIAPFYSSEGRFQPWHNWMTVLGKARNHSSTFYCLENPTCQPAVCHGPITRTPRFLEHKHQTPASNRYKVGGGIETVLFTHNKRLKNNMENQHKFRWIPPLDHQKLSLEEREALLLQKSIALLDVALCQLGSKTYSDHVIKSSSMKEINKTKLLRCFVQTDSR